MVLAELDHLVVAATELEDGVAYVQGALGLPMGGGGEHPAMGTHNRLMSLGPRDYLEVIAVDPDAAPPDRPRLFDLDTFSGAPRLANWVMRVKNLSAALAEAPEGIGAAVPLSRGPYRWQMAIPADGKLPFDGLFPSFIEWQGAHPAPALDDVEARLISLTISHPRAGALGWALSPFLDDDRVVITRGAPGMRAVIHTPAGERELV